MGMKVLKLCTLLFFDKGDDCLRPVFIYAYVAVQHIKHAYIRPIPRKDTRLQMFSDCSLCYDNKCHHQANNDMSASATLHCV